MQYPAPAYAAASASASAPVATSTVKIVVIVVVVAVVAVSVGTVALGLGLGLGLGLRKSSSDSSPDIINSTITTTTDSASTTNSTTNSTIVTTTNSTIVTTTNSTTNSTTSSATISTVSFSVLAAPTVSCNYTGGSTCGCAATKPAFLSPRIIKGYNATANSWPWIVLLVLSNATTLCGGFLVDYQYVVTAAHCVFGVKVSSMEVYGGVQSISARMNSPMRGVSSFSSHPQYINGSDVNDIAVLKLNTPFASSSTIGLCCLPSDVSLPTLSQPGVIAGWGLTTVNGTEQSDTLQQGTVQVQASSKTCSAANSSIQFCAGYSGTDVCFGDSGGPYMISQNNSWTCAGIVSSGDAVADCGANSVFTRVAFYRSYITQMMSTL